MKEKRLTPAESFSPGSGVRGALIARTGSLIASGGSAVCCWTAGCCAGCVCGVCPAVSADKQSSRTIGKRNDLDIFFTGRFMNVVNVWSEGKRREDQSGVTARDYATPQPPPRPLDPANRRRGH